MRKWTNMKFTCKAKGIPHPLLRAEQLDIKEVEKKLKLCQVRRKLISYSNNCNCALIIFGLKHTHPPTPHTHLSLSLCFTPDADMKSCRPVCPSVFMGKLKLPEQNQGRERSYFWERKLCVVQSVYYKSTNNQWRVVDKALKLKLLHLLCFKSALLRGQRYKILGPQQAKLMWPLHAIGYKISL